jgi:hypothetical protein
VNWGIGDSSFMKKFLQAFCIFAVAALACQAQAAPTYTTLRYSGTVRDASGAPAAGVRVEFYPGHYDRAGHYAEVKTDANGRYEIVQQLNPSGFWGFVNLTNSIMARDFERSLAAIQEFPEATNNIDLILQPAITLKGSVKNTEGGPVRDAELEIMFNAGSAGFLLQSQPTKADEKGLFIVPVVPQGRGYLIWKVEAKGYGSSSEGAELKNFQNSSYEFPTLVLKHADRKLAGQVLDGSGHAIAGADVRFSGKGQPENSTTKSDGQGNFFFEAVCEGKVQLDATAFSGGSPGKGEFMSSGNGALVQAGDTNVILKLYVR